MNNNQKKDLHFVHDVKGLIEKSTEITKQKNEKSKQEKYNKCNDELRMEIEQKMLYKFLVMINESTNLEELKGKVRALIK